MSFTVISRTSTNRVALDTIGLLGGITYSSSWPGGCLTATWTIDVPADFAHPALLPGRLVDIYAGCHRVWTGRMREPDRGAPWTCHAEGLQGICGDYVAIDNTGAGVQNPNTALAQAKVRGIPLLGSNPATLPTPTLAVNASSNLADLLNAVAAAQGQRWGVFADQLVTMTVDPTTAHYIYLLQDSFGRTLDGYATHIYGIYLDSATTPPRPKVVAASTNPATTATLPFGRIEASIDLTGDGPMTSANAQTLINSAASLLGQRLNTTGSLTIQPGQLLDVGGLPAALASLQAGQAIRLVGTSPDTVLGEVNYSVGLTFVIGEVDYDTVTDTATVTAVNAQRADWQAAIEQAWTRIAANPRWANAHGYTVT
jgi:hypothetical protein